MARPLKQTVVSAQSGRPETAKGDILLLALYKDTKQVPVEYAAADRAANGAVTAVLKLDDFSGNCCETSVLYVPGKIGCPRIMLAGLGDQTKFEPDALRQCIGTAVRAADRLAAARLAIALPVDITTGTWPAQRIGQAVAEGAIYGRYEFEDYLPEKKNGRPAPPKMQITLLAANSAAVRGLADGAKTGAAIAEGQNLARQIANKPANEINPPVLAQTAQKLARQFGLRCTVYTERDLARMKMNAILAVGNSSASKPRLIVLEYNGRKGGKKAAGPDAVVVGKAVTFDSGGIDIKPAPKMELMKFDKCGGCAVLGIMAAAARLRLPLRIIGMIPSAENLLSSTCWRPGDIVTTYSGKTVEILSTDAEGRMLLCDALSFATELKPKAMIDLATLTGACAVALGEAYAGLFGNNDDMIARIRQAGETSGERVWPMPSGGEYLDQMKSKMADLKNVGVREGGACSAAAFLGEFVAGIPWVHLDIACVAKPDSDKPWRNSGTTGFGVRLVLEYLRGLI